MVSMQRNAQPVSSRRAVQNEATIFRALSSLSLTLKTVGRGNVSAHISLQRGVENSSILGKLLNTLIHFLSKPQVDSSFHKKVVRRFHLGAWILILLSSKSILGVEED